MRKSKYLIGALCAVFATVSVANVASGAPGQTQDAAINVKPKQLPNSKKKRKAIRLHVKTSTFCPSCPAQVPSPAVRAVLNFDNAIQLRPGVAPKCASGQLAGRSTAEAKAACPRSIVGGGSAQVFAPTGPTSHVTFNPEVTAFNGTPRGGRPTLILHNFVAELSYAQDLVGVLKAAKGGPDFRRGRQLDVTIPPLPLAAALTVFDTSVGNGFKRGYVKANCSDRNKRINLKARFSFQDGSSLPANGATRCR